MENTIMIILGYILLGIIAAMITVIVLEGASWCFNKIGKFCQNRKMKIYEIRYCINPIRKNKFAGDDIVSTNLMTFSFDVHNIKTKHISARNINEAYGKFMTSQEAHDILPMSCNEIIPQ